MKKLTLALLVLMACAPPAGATQILLNIDHCTGNCGPVGATFGSVDLTQINPTTVEVDVDLFSPYEFVQTGFAGRFGFNILGAPTVNVAVSTPTGFQGGPAGNKGFDGFGDTMYAITYPAGRNGGVGAVPGPLTFQVSVAAGLTVQDFLTPSTGNGATGVYFVADVINRRTGATGPVGGRCIVGTDCGNQTVPEPASMLLLGTGLLSAGAFARKRKQ